MKQRGVEIDSNTTLKFILNDLWKVPIHWMKTLPFTQQLGENIFLCHGTPTNDLIYLLENVESGFAVMRSDEEILSLLDGQSSEPVFCGHTHTSRTVYTSSKQLIINPGSVGLPAYTDEEPVHHSIQSYSPLASYCIAHRQKKHWTIQHIKVAYDVEKAVKCAEKLSRNDWAHYLTTGRAFSKV